jgi:arylsulfatase A-like enzyme
VSFARLAGILIGLAFCLPAAAGQDLLPRSQPQQPNVLLLVVDDLNNDLGVYGHELVKTPHIDRLAARGVSFTRAYTQYPQCNQSRASFLTSQYPDQLQVLTLKEHVRDNQPDVVTLPQHFRNNGYFTARVGKIFHQGVPPEIGQDGLDDTASWDLAVNPAGVDIEVDEWIVSIVPPEHDKRNFGGTLSWLRLDSDQAHTDEIGAAEAERLLQEYHPEKTGQPLFLALGFYRPHTPYVAPGRFFDLYPPSEIELPEVPAGDREGKPVAALADRRFQAGMTEQQKRLATQAYYASISFMDEQVGKVLDALDASGLAENTIVLLVSDHGYQLGSHGLWQKKDLYENSLRSPLILVAPDSISEDSRSDTLVELTDIYPTLVALAGLDDPDTPIEGINLLPVLAGSGSPREAAFSQSWSAAHLVRPERRGMQVMGYSIRTNRYRYTEWSRGKEGVELYDYQTDPLEYRNLAGDESHAGIQKNLASLLDAKLKSIGSAR